ncbi:MAG TPA: hypothetical protein V6C57_21435 [Coleofasciculaceae cyanobacterium]
MLIEHPDLPYTIEPDPTAAERFIRRYPSGAIAAAEPMEYMLGLILMKLEPPQPAAPEVAKPQAKVKQHG